MSIANSFVNDMLDRLGSEAARLSKANKTKTLTSREVSTACKLVLPSDLGKHAMAEGTKALAKFASTQPKKAGKAKSSSRTKKAQ